MNDTLDIKVLRAVHLLVICGSVTKTAEMLEISPGAVSYLLNKARQCTGSALFTRTRAGMIPDSIAKELSQRYVNIFKELYDDRGAVSLSDRELTICTYSIFEFIISTWLSAQGDCPKQLHFTSPEMDDNCRLLRLRSKEIDIDIGTRLAADRSIVQTLLFTGGIKILTGKNNTQLEEGFTIENWLSCNHVRWSRRMDFICDDFQHANRFYDLMNQRNISVVSSDSLNMVVLCAYTDHVMLMPSLVATLISEKLPLNVLSPPSELEMQFDCYLHYHHTLSNEPKMLEVIRSLQNLVKRGHHHANSDKQNSH